MADWRNKLFFGDNLPILREHVADESVDLIYLDPPFNSNATYNVLFREAGGLAGREPAGHPSAGLIACADVPPRPAPPAERRRPGRADALTHP